MQNKGKTREELIERVNDSGREMGAATIFFHQAVAEKAGLSGTDHKYLDLINREGSMTAGELAGRTGLTTGAVTGLINRLEKAGLASRKPDPEDRRKVVVELNREEAWRRLGPIFQPFVRELDQVYDGFSESDLRTILDYLERMTDFLQRYAEELRSGGI